MDVISCVLVLLSISGNTLSWCHHWHMELKASWERRGDQSVCEGHNGRKEAIHTCGLLACLCLLYMCSCGFPEVMSLASRWCRGQTHTCMRCKRACWSRWSLFKWRIHQHEFTDMKSTLRETSVSPEGFVSTCVSVQPAWREPDAILGLKVKSKNESRCWRVQSDLVRISSWLES